MEGASPQSRSPIMLIVEVFAIITAASFILSALIGWLLFFVSYKINFFSIASPSDVTMGGIMLVGFSMAYGLTTLPVSLVLAILLEWIMRMADKKRPSLREVIYRYRPSNINPNTGPVGFFSLAILILASAIILPSRDAQAITTPLQTGLRIADPDAPEACQGGAVEWLGSNAAIVRCGDRVMVLRDAAKLTMVPASE